MNDKQIDLINFMNIESGELQKCRNQLFLLQIIMTLPAIISIINTELKPSTLMVLSLASTLILVYYWIIKFRYAKFKFHANDSRRGNIFAFGFPKITPSNGNEENFDQSIKSNKLADDRYYVQTKENCIHFLKTLLKFAVCSHEIYKKSIFFFGIFLVIYFILNILLFVFAIVYFGGDVRITISRVILFTTNIVFSSDILNMIIYHRFVIRRLGRIEEHLLIIDGISNIKLNVLRTNLIDVSGFYTDTLSNAYEIPPFVYKLFRRDLENRWESIQKSRAKLQK